MGSALFFVVAPGTVVGAFAVGSPVYYYLPWTPLSIVLAVILRVRFGDIAPFQVRRAWNGVIGSLAVAMITKVVLIAAVVIVLLLRFRAGFPHLHRPSTPRRRAGDTFITRASPERCISRSRPSGPGEGQVRPGRGDPSDGPVT